MNWFTGVVLYILIWVLTLFAVLPIGTQPQAEADAATGWRGAPTQVRMWRKVLITTIVATVLFAAVFVAIEQDWLSFRHGILAGSSPLYRTPESHRPAHGYPRGLAERLVFPPQTLP